MDNKGVNKVNFTCVHDKKLEDGEILGKLFTKSEQSK